jgi:hypothetical protein
METVEYEQEIQRRISRNEQQRLDISVSLLYTMEHAYNINKIVGDCAELDFMMNMFIEAIKTNNLEADILERLLKYISIVNKHDDINEKNKCYNIVRGSLYIIDENYDRRVLRLLFNGNYSDEIVTRNIINDEVYERMIRKIPTI